VTKRLQKVRPGEPGYEEFLAARAHIRHQSKLKANQKAEVKAFLESRYQVQETARLDEKRFLKRWEHSNARPGSTIDALMRFPRDRQV